MFMNIGLYGDSFGAGSMVYDPLCTTPSVLGMQYHWSTLLQEELGCSLNNHAVSGSSIYFCFKEFLKTYHLNDRNIFLITFPGRYHTSLQFEGMHSRDNIVSLGHLESFSKHPTLTRNDIEVLNDLRGWYKMASEDFDIEMSKLMLHEVMRLRPDTIFIPCFGGSLIDAFSVSANVNPQQHLCLLYHHQMAQLKLDDTGMNSSWMENSRYISGHLTPEYNRIAYRAISHLFKTGEWTLEEPKEVIFGPDKDNYYSKC